MLTINVSILTESVKTFNFHRRMGFAFIPGRTIITFVFLTKEIAARKQETDSKR